MQDGEEVFATFTLDADGRAVHDGPQWLDEVKVFVPGDPPIEVFPSDGERYLEALPATYSGTRVRAHLLTARVIGGGR